MFTLSVCNPYEAFTKTVDLVARYGAEHEGHRIVRSPVTTMMFRPLERAALGGVLNVCPFEQFAHGMRFLSHCMVPDADRMFDKSPGKIAMMSRDPTTHYYLEDDEINMATHSPWRVATGPGLWVGEAFLLEYAAVMTGSKIGALYHTSTFTSVHTTQFDEIACLADKYIHDHDPYASDDVEMFPLLRREQAPNLIQEVRMWVDEPNPIGFRTPFMRKIAAPMKQAHRHLTQANDDKALDDALSVLRDMPANNDWRTAGEKFVLAKARGDTTTWH